MQLTFTVFHQCVDTADGLSCGRKCFTIRVFKICLSSKYKSDVVDYGGTKINFDTDGIMLWNGKRCESVPMNPEEEAKLKDILSQYEI